MWNITACQGRSSLLELLLDALFIHTHETLTDEIPGSLDYFDVAPLKSHMRHFLKNG